MARDNRYEVLNIEDLIRIVTRWVIDIVLVISLALFLTYMLGTRIEMEGNSMTETLQNGDRLLLDRFSVHLSGIDRFDVLVYQLNGEDGVYLKRVLALPGEKIMIRDGKVYINGEQLPENRYISSIASAGVAEESLTLGEEEYFVIGENADASLDSRFVDVGNIPLSNVLGTIWFRYAPFKHFGWIH